MGVDNWRGWESLGDCSCYDRKTNMESPYRKIPPTEPLVDDRLKSLEERVEQLESENELQLGLIEKSKGSIITFRLLALTAILSNVGLLAHSCGAH